MAVFSALKNKKNQKMREGIEDLAIKCSEPINEKEEPQIQVDQWIEWKWIYFRANAFYFGLDFSYNEYKLEYKKLFVCVCVVPVSPIVTNIRGWD